MKHALEIWRDELIDDVTREVTREVTRDVTREVTREEDIRIARKLMEEGVDVNTIAKVTNLTVDEILQL